MPADTVRLPGRPADNKNVTVKIGNCNHRRNLPELGWIKVAVAVAAGSGMQASVRATVDAG